MHNFVVTKDVYDLAHNDPSYAGKFLIMQKQQYPELFKNKPTTTKKYDKKLLQLSDGANTIKLYVSNNIYDRAINNPQLATELLNKYNKGVDEQIPHCIDTNVCDDKVKHIFSQNIQLDINNESEDTENLAATSSITGILTYK